MWEFLLHSVAYGSMGLLGLRSTRLLSQWRDPEIAMLRVVEQHLLTYPEEWDSNYNGDVVTKGTDVRLHFYTKEFPMPPFHNIQLMDVNGVTYKKYWAKRLRRASQRRVGHAVKIVNALRPPESPLQIEARKARVVS